LLAGTSPPEPNPASPGGRCTDPGDAAHPTFADRETRSAIRWQASDGLAADRTDVPVPGDGSQIDTGETRTLTYTVRIPAEVPVSTVFDNTASVRSFNAFTNELGETTTYFPAENVDTTVDPLDATAPAASDPSQIFLPDAALTKQVARTGVTESNNNNTNNGDAPAERGQATNGETATFRIGVTIPAETTVYQGSLTDDLPSDLVFVAATVAFSATGQSPATEPLPDGFTFDGTTGAVTFPATYTNSTDDDQLVEVEIVARVTPTAGGNNSVKTNTARFVSSDAPAGGDRLPELTDTAGVQVVIPNPTLTKTNEAEQPIDAGSVVTYRLRVSNAVNRPPLHDAVVVDCLPDGLTFVAFTTVETGSTSTSDGDGTNGCPVGSTRIEWTLETPVDARDVFEASYTAIVDDTVVGGVTYTNTATLTGSTLADGANDPTMEQVLTRTRSSNVGVAAATLTKTVTPDTLTFGERATFTVVGVFPQEINFYNTALIDTLPAGFDPDSVELDAGLSGCTQPDGQPCGLGGVSGLEPAPGPGGSTLIGWSGGDLPISDQPRTITVVYSALLDDATAPAALGRGDELVNAATARWDITAGDAATSVTDSFDRTSNPPATATVTVTEPELSVTKAVSDETPGPTDPFTYTVTVTNSDDELVSDAHDVVVVDDVPLGVVVTSVGGGGQYVPLDPAENGGGTITWLLPGPVPPGGTVTLTYEAELAPSPTLDETPLTNTVVVDDYATAPEGTVGRRSYPDRDPSATATVTPQFPSLVVAKTTPDGELAYIDESFRWRITVTNSGGAVAENVVVTDTLPPNWTYVAGSLLTTVGGVPVAGDPLVSVTSDADGNETTTITTVVPVTLPPGQTLVAELRAVPRDDDDISVVRLPGVGSDVEQVNTVSTTGEDASGAPGNADGPYAGDDTAVARIDSADLAVEKTPDPGVPVAGETFTWTLTISNLGPDDARGFVRVVDRLPSDPDAPATDPVFVSATGDGWSCLQLGPLVECERAMTDPDESERPFPAGTSEEIEVTVAIPADVPDGTEYLNAAAVSSRTHDPDLANNTDEVPATVSTQADLAIVKRLSGPLTAGEDATYTLDVRNNGPSTARADVVVTDTLPPGSSFVSASGAGWACEEAAGEVTCTLDGDLPAGSPAGQITLVVAIPPSQTDDVVNTTSVQSTVTPDPVESNDTSTVTDPVTVLADLVLEKESLTPPDFVAGQDPATYRFTTVNAGPSDTAGPLSLTDLLPAGLTFGQVGADADGWTCTAGPLDGEGREPLTCTRPAGLPAEAQTSFTVEVAIDPSLGVDLPPGDLLEIRNSATVSSPTDDPDEQNNTNDDLTTSPREADLAISKVHAPEPVVAGQSLTFTLQVENLGRSTAAADVVVTDALPTELAFDSFGATDGWECSHDGAPAGGQIRCVLGTVAGPLDLEPGAAPPIELVVTVDPAAGPATITNRASTGSLTPDPDLTNNVADDAVTIRDVADVTIVKTTTGDNPVLAGETTQFTLQVSNAGPSDADAVSVRDELPAGLSVEAIDAGEPWECAGVGTPVVDCVLADPLQPGVAAPDIVVTAAVSSAVPDGTTLTNTARVSTSSPQGPNADPDEDSSDVSVGAAADLVLTKTLVEPTGACAPAACAGEQVEFSIEVRNDGPSDAQPALEVVDTLPPLMSFVAASDGWTCTADPAAPTPDAGQVVTCVRDGEESLPAGESITLDVRALVDAAAPAETLENAAVVCPDGDEPVPAGGLGTQALATCPTTDPDRDNNDDTATVPVEQLVDLGITKSHTGPVRVGDPLTFTLEVTNAGPSTATAVTVTDVLPGGLSDPVGTGVDGAPWTCAAAAPTADGIDVTCTLADPLPPGETSAISLTVVVGPEAFPSVTNTATVTTQTPESTDPEELPDTATDVVEVPAQADLAITKTHEGDFTVAETGEFVLSVTNNGPTRDPGPITVTDRVPSGLSPVQASGAGWSCDISAQQVTCVDADGLDVGETGEITLSVDVLAQAVPGVRNTASVSSPAEDTEPANDSATDEVTVLPAPTPPGGGGGTGLPTTGADLARLAGLAGLLVLAGAAALGASHRWRRRGGAV
jgi:large repetitive protein